MASFLDMAFVGKFSIIFTFLLVFVLVYALLEVSGIFGKEKKSLSALLALAMGVIVVASQTMTTFVHFIIPWLFAFVLVAFFLLFITKIFGGEKMNFGIDPQGVRRTKTFVIAIVIVIIIFGLGKALGDQTLKEGRWDGSTEVTETITEDSEYVYVDAEGNVVEVKGSSSSQTTTSGGKGVATNDFSTNMVNTMFNPKVLGFILVMLVGAFAMFFLAD
jgi:hypothetical protein